MEPLRWVRNSSLAVSQDGKITLFGSNHSDYLLEGERNSRVLPVSLKHIPELPRELMGSLPLQQPKPGSALQHLFLDRELNNVFMFNVLCDSVIDNHSNSIKLSCCNAVQIPLRPLQRGVLRKTLSEGH